MDTLFDAAPGANGASPDADDDVRASNDVRASEAENTAPDRVDEDPSEPRDDNRPVFAFDDAQGPATRREALALREGTSDGADPSGAATRHARVRGNPGAGAGSGAGAGEALMRFAYRMGVPGHAISAPFRRPEPLRLLATVDSPNTGERAAGIALRAGHFSVYGIKQPISGIDFAAGSRLAPELERAIHSFSWLADLSASAPRSECVPTAERIARGWLDANGTPGKGAAWELENAGLRLMAWLVHAPLVLAGQDEALKPRMLSAIAQTASWVEARAGSAGAGMAQIAAHGAVTAAGLLLPQGKPRRLCAEAALVRALGELVGEDGGTLARCPATQIEAIRLLTDLVACYDATGHEPPDAVIAAREVMVPPLLALVHGDGGAGSWQGQSAIPRARIEATLAATGIRAAALDEPGNWGFQRIAHGDTIVQFDAGPPPRARHTRCGAASTLAFELSDGPERIVVNCGGAAHAGGQVPARIGQGLRASAAHSTLVIDDTNSTAVLLHGKLGRGVETVEVERGRTEDGGTHVEACHDGYAARFGLVHTRALTLSSDGTLLAGEDVLAPASRRGKRGRVGFALRFHLGRAVDARLAQDGRGAELATPGGPFWRFDLHPDDQAKGDGGEDEIRLSCEDSLWVDGGGRPHPTRQLVIEGLVSRGGGRFSWTLRKTG